MKHHPDDLIMLFNDLFRRSHQTVLVKGGDEPEYIPAAGPDQPARIVFAHGFYASALHEISHWCIAGARRRGLHDYGYWYCPDGRTAAQQQAFESVEVRPQALEWLFSVAAGSRFHISVDNLSGQGAADEAGFRARVRAMADHYLRDGLPARAARFHQTLLTFYGRQTLFAQAWQDQGLTTSESTR
ncbi:MAG: elongation factor P hydroxylase [Marinobacter sp.]|nr:elongation factor P hydroxylase [Marinobacter sp.]MDX1633001.1 elongation factor P hydroxylase [Marinobacter sp.]